MTTTRTTSAWTPTRRSVLRGGLATAGASVLAGCGGGASGSAEALTFWNFYSPAPQQDPVVVKQSNWFLRLIKEWNQENEHQVEPIYIPGEAYHGNMATKLPTAFAAGDGPDIFLVSPGDFLRFYNGDALVDLAPYMTDEAKSDFYDNALATRIVDGGIYALPMEVEPLAMYYSIPAFEDAGISEGDLPSTWDELLAVGEKARTKTRAGLVFETGASYFQNFTWYPWMWQNGGQAIDLSGTNVTFDSPKVYPALELWQRATQEGIAPRTLPSNGDVVSALAEDYAAMWQSGIWEISAFRENNPDFKYGVFPLPTPNGGQPSTALGGWAFAANARGRNPEAAAKFCVEAVGSMNQASIDRVAEWCDGAKSDIPPRKSVMRKITADGAFDSGKMKLFKDDIFPNGRGEPRYPPPIYKAISNAIQGTQLAGDPARSRAKEATEAIEAYLKTYDGGKIL